MPESKLSAIIVAAGSSRRMGFDKLESQLCGETVLNRSMKAFQNCTDVTEFIVVTSPEKIASVQEAVERLNLTKFVAAVEGGAERHLSVHAGLEKADQGCALVAVHDAARPLISAKAISRCASVAAKSGAASLAHRVADTLKRADSEGRVCEAVSRENLWAMETPQIFRIDLLLEAYRAVLDQGEIVTDEVSALEAIGHAVELVENTEPNFKITVPADLALAEALLQAKRK